MNLFRDIVALPGSNQPVRFRAGHHSRSWQSADAGRSTNRVAKKRVADGCFRFQWRWSWRSRTRVQTEITRFLHAYRPLIFDPPAAGRWRPAGLVPLISAAATEPLRLPTHHAMLPYRRRVDRSPGNSRIWLIGLIKQPTRELVLPTNL